MAQRAREIAELREEISRLARDLKSSRPMRYRRRENIRRAVFDQLQGIGRQFIPYTKEKISYNEYPREVNWRG